MENNNLNEIMVINSEELSELELNFSWCGIIICGSTCK